MTYIPTAVTAGYLREAEDASLPDRQQEWQTGARWATVGP
jgi:hypothetical protein